MAPVKTMPSGSGGGRGSVPADARRYDTGILDRALRARRRRLAGEQAELRPRVERTLLALCDRFGVRSAYVVGSLRSPDRWREGADVDVAVGGCSHAVLDVMKAIEGRDRPGRRRHRPRPASAPGVRHPVRDQGVMRTQRTLNPSLPS